MRSDLTSSVLVIGGGHAGAAVVQTLRRLGHAGPITLASAEVHPPYHKPPLSKGCLLGEVPAERLALLPEGFWAAEDVALRLGDPAVGLDAENRAVTFASGVRLAADRIVLAHGAGLRPAPFPGAALPGVHSLRTREDADALGAALVPGARVVVVGAGYIGLEAAAAARARGAGRVTVLEAADRILSRAASTPIAAAVARRHRANGTQIFTSVRVAAIELGTGAALSVRLADGGAIDADVVVLGIGVAPRIGLAAEAGLATDGGVLVDAAARTSAPGIYAAGDLTAFDSVRAGGRIRLECVQNAVDQAKAAAADITAAPAPGERPAWFWSDQGEIKLQTCGFLAPAVPEGVSIVRGDAHADAFSVWHFRDGVLLGAEAIDAPADFAAARKLVELGATVSPADLGDPSLDLRALVAAVAKAA